MTRPKALVSPARNPPGRDLEGVPDVAQPQAMNPLVVTEFEAAQMLRLSPRSLQRLRLVGDGPAYVNLTPGRIGYPVANLQAWLAARVVTSTSAATVGRKAAAE